MRFLLRFVSLVSLAAATIAGTLDSIQSVAASKVLITSFADGWKELHASSFDKWYPYLSHPDQPHFYDSAARWLLVQPAFAVLLAVSLLLWVIAYRKAPVPSGLAA